MGAHLSHRDLFLSADFAPHNAGPLSRALGDARLGPGYMRITTALPEDNARLVAALRQLL